MSAIVCGKRSNIFEDLPTTPPVSKRIRCSPSSPVRFSPPRAVASSSFVYPNNHSSPSQSVPIDHLRDLFPDMDKQLLERALELCGNDLDSAIKRLNELHLSSTDNCLEPNDSGSNTGAESKVQIGFEATGNTKAAASEDPTAPKAYPVDGAEWVEVFVREMMSASDMDDAKARASRVLGVLEESICARATSEAALKFQQENMMLKEQVEALVQENVLLKRAVSIQHERQKEFEFKSQEVQHLKQIVSQYQEQLRTLEVNNYALTMHLKQAQQGTSIPGRFNPDVF